MATSTIKQPINLFHDSVSDCNDAVYTGFYPYLADMANSAKAKVAGSGNMLVIRGSAFIHQIVFIGNTSILIRRSNYVSWNEWRAVGLS